MSFKISHAGSVLLGIIVFVQFSAVGPNLIAFANSRGEKSNAKPATDWYLMA